MPELSITQDWKIEATRHTPEICFNAQEQVLAIKGESYPENACAFAAPLFAWLEGYFANCQMLTINIELVYFNSSFSKTLLDFFARLETAVVDENKQIVVNWIYEADNDSAEEYGEEFQEDLEQLPFNLVRK
jgi:hypothetical protein